MPSSINPGFSLSDHLHDILYESETAPRLPSAPITRDLPFSCEPVHPAPVNGGIARRPGVDRRAAGGFPVAREGVDELWGQRVLLVLEPETAVARTAPDEDVSAMRVNVGSRRGEGGVEGRHKTRSVPVRIDCKTVVWPSGDLDDLPVVHSFYGSLSEKGRTPDFCMSGNANDVPGLSSESNTVRLLVMMCSPVRPLPS